MIIKYINKLGKKKSGKRVVLNCNFCSDVFETLQTKIRSGKEKFCSNVCYKNFRSKNKQDPLEKNILSQKKNKYNLTKEQYYNLFEIQNNCCAICNNVFSTENKYTKGSVDHCHITGKIRGLLCNNCNTGLGMFKDDLELLKSAIVYLEKNNAPKHM